VQYCFYSLVDGKNHKILQYLYIAIILTSLFPSIIVIFRMFVLFKLLVLGQNKHLFFLNVYFNGDEMVQFTLCTIWLQPFVNNTTS